MLEAAGSAFQSFADPAFLLFFLGGIIVGLFIGIVPAVGSMVVLALFLPFTFRLPLEYTLCFMIAVLATNATGGSITSILLNVPGGIVNVATMLDGYPMARKGQASRALGAALMASAAGGSVTVLFALVTIPLILPVVMAIRSSEMVFIVLMGLCFIAAVAGKSKIKGLISGGLGILLAFVGVHPVTGAQRFTFDSLYFYDGIPLIPLSLGLFAVAQVLQSATETGATAKGELMAMQGLRQVWEGGKDVFRHWKLWLRCAALGYYIGILPGIGAAVGIFVAYAQAKHTSKHPEEFGKGAVEGVIAPETVNNASTSGDLLCTLALGIPGSAPMALILAAFIMAGIQPGPEMLTKHLDVSLNLMVVLFMASLLGAAICFPLASRMALLANVPVAIVAPITLVVALVGVYAWQLELNDLIIAVLFGVIGFGLDKFGFNRAALLLGFILGGLFEKYLFIAYSTDGPMFFTRPISLGLIVIIFLLFGLGPTRRLIKRKMAARRAA